jgi:hypothetical protein
LRGPIYVQSSYRVVLPVKSPGEWISISADRIETPAFIIAIIKSGAVKVLCQYIMAREVVLHVLELLAG